MTGSKRVILHITFDGIFFDRIYSQFESMNGYENRYLLHNWGVNKNFHFIKNSEKIICADSLESWGKIIGDTSVDIIYLHGLWHSYFKAFDYIRPNTIVMWWCYGMEIYENSLGWPPLLPLKLYKPRTHWFCLTKMMSVRLLAKELSRVSPGLFVLFRKAFNIIQGRRSDELRYVLSRIDFAFTPLDIELVELKKRYPYIKAKPFQLQGTILKIPFNIHNEVGSVLLEHSANITNNHLDIIACLKKKKINFCGRDVYIPLSYGEKKFAERVKDKATFEDAHVHCLMEVLPFEDYNEMMSGCTHAIYGMIRQSGLGNIYLCFRKGIKVFFFKDSILFKHFKSEGYHVFSIEDNLNDNSLREPLTPEEAKDNYDIFYRKFDGSAGTYEQQFDKILKIEKND